MSWDYFVKRRNLDVPKWYQNSGFKNYDEFFNHLNSQGLADIPTPAELNILLGVVDSQPTPDVVPLKEAVTKKKRVKKQVKRKKEKGRKKNDEHATEPIIDSLYGE
jgi:hypothetical protein